VKIEELEIVNFKGVKAVKVKPDGRLIYVIGKNGTGKSSVIDAIARLLKGKGKDAPSRPVTKGKDKSDLIADLGDYTVERVIPEGGADRLKVESKEGASFKSPQKLLDKFFSDIGLEPAEFANADPKKQTETLLKLVPFNVDKKALKKISGVKYDVSAETGLDAVNAGIEILYDARRNAARDAKSKREVFDAIEIPEGAEDAKRVSITELVQEQGALQLEADANKETERIFAEANSELEAAMIWVGEVEEELAKAKAREARATAAQEKAQAENDKIEEVNFTEINAKLHGADEQNRIAAEVEKKKGAAKELEGAEALATDLSKRLEAVREYKEKLLTGAKFPVKKMSINDDGEITIGGIPLRDRSTAENILAGMEIGKALKPELKVMLFRDGNVLDADTVKALKKWVKDNDYQVWVEKVTDAKNVEFEIEAI